MQSSGSLRSTFLHRLRCPIPSPEVTGTRHFSRLSHTSGDLNSCPHAWVAGVYTTALFSSPLMPFLLIKHSKLPEGIPDLEIKTHREMGEGLGEGSMLSPPSSPACFLQSSQQCFSHPRNPLRNSSRGWGRGARCLLE